MCTCNDDGISDNTLYELAHVTRSRINKFHEYPCKLVLCFSSTSARVTFEKLVLFIFAVSRRKTHENDISNIVGELLETSLSSK